MTKTMYDDNFFKIVCKKCKTKVVQAQTIDQLFERFLKKAVRNNMEDVDEELCEYAKNDLSIDNLRSTFSSGHFEVLVPKEFNKAVSCMEWQSSEELLEDQI